MTREDASQLMELLTHLVDRDRRPLDPRQKAETLLLRLDQAGFEIIKKGTTT
jgi:hypothetical protein